jgi:hypothetical protein
MWNETERISHTGGLLLNELPRNEQSIFTNIARTDELQLSVNLANTEPHAYEHFNKLVLTDLMIYLMNK